MKNLTNKNDSLFRNSCLRCGEKLRQFRLKLIPTNNPNPIWPKYIPQIKEICSYCKSYIQFVPQSSELIDRINEKLKEVVIE